MTVTYGWIPVTPMEQYYFHLIVYIKFRAIVQSC